MHWFLFVASLPGQQAALRVRVWRSLKGLGAATLRDGVYLLPGLATLRAALEEQRMDVIAGGGSAFVLTLSAVEPADETAFVALFDRSVEHAELRRALNAFALALPGRTEVDARRALRQLKRDIASADATNFFPGSDWAAVLADLRTAEASFTQAFSPGEPAAIRAGIPRRTVADYQRRTWATRKRLWVDRVASAWLVRRFIDPDAQFVWLQDLADLPPLAIGFDFDGAEFTHVDQLVTFEVLLESFGFTGDVGLQRLGAVVHQLDVGGNRIAEASGFEAVLTGARESCRDDDALLERMSAVLDDLHAAFALVQ